MLAFIRKHIPSVQLKAETLREYHFIIPLSERSNPNFWDLFSELESNLKHLNINSFGIHDVSLEEVFIKAAEIDQEDQSSSFSTSPSPSTTRAPVTLTPTQP